MQEGTRGTVIQDFEDYSTMVASPFMATRRYFRRGGFSPEQWVFGCNPRLPSEVRSDEDQDFIALHDLGGAHGQLLTGMSA